MPNMIETNNLCKSNKLVFYLVIFALNSIKNWKHIIQAISLFGILPNQTMSKCLYKSLFILVFLPKFLNIIDHPLVVIYILLPYPIATYDYKLIVYWPG